LEVASIFSSCKARVYDYYQKWACTHSALALHVLISIMASPLGL
jgi:hypothetical protein